MEYLVKFKQNVTREEDNYITISADSEQEANQKVRLQKFDGPIQPDNINIITRSTPEIIDSIDITGVGTHFQEFLKSACGLCKKTTGNVFKISGVDPKLLEYVKARFGNCRRYCNDNTFEINGNSIELEANLDISEID